MKLLMATFGFVLGALCASSFWSYAFFEIGALLVPGILISIFSFAALCVAALEIDDI